MFFFIWELFFLFIKVVHVHHRNLGKYKEVGENHQ